MPDEPGIRHGGSEHDIRARVKAVLAREWRVSADAIPDTAALNGSPHWDSLGHITVLLALQQEFGIDVTAETVQSLTSFERIVAHVAAGSVAAAV